MYFILYYLFFKKYIYVFISHCKNYSLYALHDPWIIVWRLYLLHIESYSLIHMHCIVGQSGPQPHVRPLSFMDTFTVLGQLCLTHFSRDDRIMLRYRIHMCIQAWNMSLRILAYWFSSDLWPLSLLWYSDGWKQRVWKWHRGETKRYEVLQTYVFVSIKNFKFALKAVVQPKMKICWKCTHHQAKM